MLRFLLCFAFLVLPGTVFAWPATVTNVYDGDTLTVACAGDEECQLFVRLYGVDAPELAQNGGNAARLFLADLVPLKSQVEVLPMALDAHGRVIALLARNGQVVNGRLVREGHAWVEQSCRAMICRAWLRQQKTAQESAKGLWQEKNAQAPWLFDKKEGALPMAPAQSKKDGAAKDNSLGAKPGAKSTPQWLPLDTLP